MKMRHDLDGTMVLPSKAKRIAAAVVITSAVVVAASATTATHDSGKARHDAMRPTSQVR